MYELSKHTAVFNTRSSSCHSRISPEQKTLLSAQPMGWGTEQKQDWTQSWESDTWALPLHSLPTADKLSYSPGHLPVWGERG